MTQERWVDIPGYEELYRVSDRGRVMSMPRPTPCSRGIRVIRERILKFQLSGTVGYPTVTLLKRGIPFTATIHKLVMLAFIGPRPDGMEVCHWDGNAHNNALENLRYATRASNREDGHRLGEIPLGSERTNSKLTEADVISMRHRVGNGESHRMLAKEFGVSPLTVGRIVRREKWRHVL